MGEKDRMRPTQMLLVRLSLREFQELDTSAQALQSQLRSQHVFSRFSKKTFTKKLTGLLCLALFCAGTGLLCPPYFVFDTRS